MNLGLLPINYLNTGLMPWPVFKEWFCSFFWHHSIKLLWGKLGLFNFLKIFRNVVTDWPQLLFSLWLSWGYRIPEMCACVYALPCKDLLTCVCILRDLMWFPLLSMKLIYIAIIMSPPSFYVPQWLYLFIERKRSGILEYILKIHKSNLQCAYLSDFIWVGF